jgi:formylglycine-generating enzyme required for sulfatase activity
MAAGHRTRRSSESAPRHGDPEAGETYAEVAHEAVFKRWEKLRDWIAAEREFLAWRAGLEAARRAWEKTPEESKPEALLVGAALTHAQSWLSKRGDDLLPADRVFIDQSASRDNKARARARRVQALVYVLLISVIAELIGWINQSYIKKEMNWVFVMRPYKAAQVLPSVLNPERERALKPDDTFRECAKDCPEMVVVPAGEFMMGSPPNEKGRYPNQGPQHKVTIAKPFAVAKYDVTFAEWDACVKVGGCPQEGRASDAGFGRGKQPIINVSWDDAKAYVAWLSRMTGKTYRLLAEAEWEYAARAGTATPYHWGEDAGKNNANCIDCGSKWDDKSTAPVGSFKSNAFGLYDMAGNVWQRVEDCSHDDYDGAPTDGSAWLADGCNYHVVRAGSWNNIPRILRSAIRSGNASSIRLSPLGFRVGRTLIR